MYPNPQDALPLPSRPDVDQYRKLAKDLVKACQSEDAAAVQLQGVAFAGRAVRDVRKVLDVALPDPPGREQNPNPGEPAPKLTRQCVVDLGSPSGPEPVGQGLLDSGPGEQRTPHHDRQPEARQHGQTDDGPAANAVDIALREGVASQ